MAHPPEKRVQLRAAYISGLPLERAAEQVGVAYGTARNWYREDKGTAEDWDKRQRAGLVVAGGGIEQALGSLVVSGLLRCEALLAAMENAEDPFEAVRAMGTLGDTVAKLKAASKGMMPEADALAIENGAIKALADLFIRMHPKAAEMMLATVEAWAGGQR